MRVARLYLQEPLETGWTIELDDIHAHYVRNVLRLKKAAIIVLFNGDGREYSCRLLAADRKHVVVDVGPCIDRTVESPLQVTLGLAVTRSDRMDMALQKAVELGVYRITPLVTERCVVQMKAAKKKQKSSHWQKIVWHATEQSGRTVIPQLDQPLDLPSWLQDQTGLKVFLDPYAQTSLTQLSPLNNQVTLLTGPEGGFTDTERERAIDAGFTTVRLGQRILRAETAVLTSLAAVQMLWGDFASADEKQGPNNA